MKYLKKFATAEEYAAFVESGQMKRPNVSLVEEPFTTYYNKYIPLGVFIQHVDGTLYTEADWTNGGFSNDAANGVAVITNNTSFVVANNSVEVNAWEDQTLVDGVYTTSDINDAKSDFRGYANTQAFLNTGKYTIATAAAEYVFPNGKNGYAPSMGEIWEMLQYKKQIVSAQTLIGANSMSQNHVSSSTQADAYMVWKIYWGGSNKYVETYSKSFSSTTIPLLRLF